MADNNVVFKVKADFDNAIKEWEQLRDKVADTTREFEDAQKEIEKLKIAKGEFTGEIYKTKAQLKAESDELKKSNLEYKKREKELNRVFKVQEKNTKSIKGLTKKQIQQKDATGSATSATMELSRVISDAPYGIRGMANNITQLVSQLGTASTKSGGLTGALKLMAKQLTGPLGVVFAITVVVSALDYLFGAQKKVKKSTEDFNKELKKAIEVLNGYKNALDLSNLSLEEKDGLIKASTVSSAKFLKIIKDSSSSLTEQTQALNRLVKAEELELKTKAKVNKLEKLNTEISKNKIKGIDNVITKRNELVKKLQEFTTFETEQTARSKDRLRGEINGLNELIGKYDEQKKLLIEINKIIDNKGLDDSEQRGELGRLNSQLSQVKRNREYRSNDLKEYKAYSLAIKEIQKSIDKITGGTDEGGSSTSKKFSPFKTKKELEIDVKDNEKALLDLSRKIKIQELKNQEATELLGVKDADKKFQIKKKYAERLLEIQLTSEKKQLILRKSIERAVMQQKFENFQKEAMLRLEAYKDRIAKSDIDEGKKKDLIKNAEGDTASLISKSDKELTISKEDLDKKYEPIFILFENLAVLRRNALGISIGKDGEGTKEEELGSLEDYLNAYKELMGGVSDFISAEYDRQMAIEENKTNALNEELNNRLLNENLSKEERKRIQNEIGQNDEKLRKRQEQIARKKFETEKAFNISSAIIDTFAGASKALAQGGVFGIASGTAIIAQGLLNVAQIARQKFQSSSANTPVNTGAGGGSDGEGVGDREFNFNLVGNTQNNQLLETLQSQFERPLQAFVVSKDITTQQELDANIRSGASI